MKDVFIKTSCDFGAPSIAVIFYTVDSEIRGFVEGPQDKAEIVETFATKLENMFK